MSTTSSMETEQVCRTCLRVSGEEDTFQNLNELRENVSFREKLQVCVPEMVITDNDTTCICTACVQLLESSYTFKNICLKTEKELKKILSHCYQDLVKMAKTTPNASKGEQPSRQNGVCDRNSASFNINDQSYVVDIEQNLAISIGKQVCVQKKDNFSKRISHIGKVTEKKNDADHQTNTNSNSEKKSLSDRELVVNACKSIKELQNLTPEMLDCAVSLEKIQTRSATKKKQLETQSVTPTSSNVDSQLHKRRRAQDLDSMQKRRRTVSERRHKSPPVLTQEVECPAKDRLLLEVKSTAVVENVEEEKKKRQRRDGYYSCIYCRHPFPSFHKCLVHERRVHTKEKPFVCSTCNCGFYENYLLTAHIRKCQGACDAKQATPPNPSVASTSTRSVVNSEEPPVLEAQALPEPETLIPEVTMKEEPEEQMRESVVEVERNAPLIKQEIQLDSNSDVETISETTEYTCSWCKVCYNSGDSLAEHMKIHRCPTCEATLVTDTDRETHRCAQLPCNLCGVMFETEETRAAHQQLHASPRKDKKGYVCLTCNLVVMTKDHFNMHNGKRPYACDICAKPFASKSTMKKHKRLHTEDKQYTCGVCNRGFVKEWNFMMHKKTHRSKSVVGSPIKEIQENTSVGSSTSRRVGDFNCDFCKLVFQTETQRLEHVCLNKNGERMFNCQICKKTMVGRASFIDHVRKHFVEEVGTVSNNVSTT